MANIEPEPTDQVIEVACAVIARDGGELLLAQRPVGKLSAGKWEFPGGKIEAGESSAEALERELHEELGIRVETATFLARLRQTYRDRTVWLDVWRVDAFAGQVAAREAQGLAWMRPRKVMEQDVLPSCWRVLTAFRLPQHYVFSPSEGSLDAWLPWVRELPPNALLRLRRPKLDDDRYYSEARRLMPVCAQSELGLILDRDPSHIVPLGAAGWHANGAALRDLGSRPLPHGYWCLASVHDPDQIRRAWQAGLDAAVLGPVQSTASHPGKTPLGWDVFFALARQAGLPLYAIGGVGPGAGPIGSWMSVGMPRIAGISAYWPSGEGSHGTGSSAGRR